MKTSEIPSILSDISNPLPWERASGHAEGVGICLSGGGLRSASFAFGVLQVLQEEQALLFGPRCARFLSVVSGGSYIAASYLLGAVEQRRDPKRYSDRPPLAEGSPEATHILHHGRYLTHLLGRFVALGVLNVFALAVLFVWLGTILADFALVSLWLEEWLVDQGVPDNALMFRRELPLAILAGLFLVGWWVIVRFYYAAAGLRWIALPSALLLFAVLDPLLNGLAAHGDWWAISNLLTVLAIFTGLLVALTVAAPLARRIKLFGVSARFINTLALITPRTLGLTLLAWSAVWWYRWFEQALRSVETQESFAPLVIFFGSLVAGAVFSYVPNRASLHRAYRDGLKSCFCVKRVGDAAVVAADPLLSELDPEKGDPRFPRLLVCATANVHARVASGGTSTFAPFVLSHDVSGVPGHAGASFRTEKLELGREPAALLTRKREPLVSLFTAVATTGAAISPSMGRLTIPTLRPFIAAANIRLGRWFPNPFQQRAHDAVARRSTPGTFDYRIRTLGPGYDELIPELIGIEGPRVYVSDGGHYDNLGLLALLRARCAVIVCVDSSPDAKGKADELNRVLAVARAELKIPIEINLGRFAANTDRLYHSTHTIGRIHYPGTESGYLIVLKLGVSKATPVSLLQRQVTDRGMPIFGGTFPHHATFPEQFYGFRRMDAYRLLGRDSTLHCLSDPEAGPALRAMAAAV